MDTLGTLIRDPQTDAVLAPYAELYSKAVHWTFRELHIRECKWADVKKEALVKFGITARQFNSVKVEVDQAVEAWKGALKYRICSLEDRIEDLGKVIAEKTKKDLWFSVHQKKRKLAATKRKLEVLKAEITGKPKLCFGGRAELRKALRANGKERQKLLLAWKTRRASQILIIGSSDETCGNQSCQWDGGSLLIKLPPALGGKRVRLENVRFSYGAAELAQRDGKALTWRLFKCPRGRWHAHVSFDVSGPPRMFHLEKGKTGAIRVDVNADHLAVSIVDRAGNLIGYETLDFPAAYDDLTTGGREQVIRNSVTRIAQLATEHNCGIVVEDLDFAKKKAYLKKLSNKTNRKRLSAFAYAKFPAFLGAKCAKLGIELRATNPVYTSQIGAHKYMLGHRITRHHAAALVIARRGLGFSAEKFRCVDHGTLRTAVSMAGRHVGFFHDLNRSEWKHVTRLSSTELGRLASTSRGNQPRFSPAWPLGESSPIHPEVIPEEFCF